MKTKKVELWAKPDADSETGFIEILHDPHQYRWGADEDVKMGEVEVMWEHPADLTEQQMILKAVETMKEKQEKIVAEAQRKKTELQTKINNLLMLTHVV